MNRARRISNLGLAVGLLTAGGFANPAHAGDDWSLERKDSDPRLVDQRMAKLRRNPFDGSQWNALVRAIGLQGLQREVAAARRGRPDNIALQILEARLELARDESSQAADRLAALQSQAGRWSGRVFDMRITALERASRYKEAIDLLERDAAERPRSGRKEPIARAFEIAERANRPDDALRLAQALGELEGASSSATLRVARAALRAGQPALADKAYGRAIAASGKNRDELLAEQARARLAAGNPSGAATLLWSLLKPPRRGRSSTRDRLWDQLLDAHRQAASLEVLVAKLRPWLEANPREAAAWKTLAMAQQGIGIDPTEAWRQASVRAPRDGESAMALIDGLESRGKTDDAIAVAEELIATNPGEVEVALSLASRLLATDRAKGMQLARAVEARVGRNPRGLLLLLDFFNLNDEPEMALDVAQRLVKAHPRNAEARIALGEQLYQMQDVSAAQREWSMLPKLIRPSHKGFARYAQVLSEHGRTSEAVYAIKKAMKLAPKQAGYVRLRAVLAEEQRRPTQALELWERVRDMADGPQDKLLRAEARTRVIELLVGGAILQRRNRLERARRVAQASLDAGEPIDEALEAGLFLAELFTRQENYPAAVKVQQRLFTLKPGDPNRLEELASAQRRAGQVRSAMQTMEQLLDADPSRSADALATMSELAFEAGDPDLALRVATRAAKRDRDQVEALVRLGQLHERRGDVDAAAKVYERALKTAPRDHRARLRLAELELTRNRPERSEILLREILEHGARPELLREAGLRALDLAEANDHLPELLALAVTRAAQRPDADEPREFLIEALDRMDPRAVVAWLDADPASRQHSIRGPLVAALSRGSIKARLRAADHLGRLGLPDTAVPLVRMAATLTPPRDSTKTVRDAFALARLTAILAAGQLRDPEAVPAFASLLGDHNQTGAVRRAAAWSLAWSGTRSGAQALVPYLSSTVDTQVAAMACLAIAGQPRSTVDPDTATEVAMLARRGGDSHLRRACAFAEASMTPDRNLGRIRDQLLSSDPYLAAIAAWRLGSEADPTDATFVALYRRMLGPAGLARDAAAAALARQLGASLPDSSVTPERATGRGWGTAVDRWLRVRVAPSFAPLAADRLADTRSQLRDALDHSLQGTRAERIAASEAVKSCAQPDAICLRPFVDGPVELPSGSRLD